MNKTNQRLQLWLEIFLVSFRLGLTSFGGPTAHLGYFHEEYIKRRKWMDEKNYADLVALAHFLPGPSSSQVGMGIGVMRGGIIGGIISFLGFTFPSVIVLILFASFLHTIGLADAGWIHGLKIVAVVIVFNAILGMAKNFTPDIQTKTIALFALVITLLFQTAYTQIAAILLAGAAGFLLFRKNEVRQEEEAFRFPVSKRAGLISLTIFLAILIILPILREITSNPWVSLMDSFYRVGSLVFGGGHVVLPLLEQELVPTGWLSQEEFLAGYGATQAVPGPLFTFASYLGTVIGGIGGGLFATLAIFLPAFLLIVGTLPFWNTLRENPKIKAALVGVNASVVGILLSALYNPIWTSSIYGNIDFALAALLFTMLAYFKLPPWVIVLTGALGGSLISLL